MDATGQHHNKSLSPSPSSSSAMTRRSTSPRKKCNRKRTPPREKAPVVLRAQQVSVTFGLPKMTTTSRSSKVWKFLHKVVEDETEDETADDACLSSTETPKAMKKSPKSELMLCLLGLTFRKRADGAIVLDSFDGPSVEAQSSTVASILRPGDRLDRINYVDVGAATWGEREGGEEGGLASFWDELIRELDMDASVEDGNDENDPHHHHDHSFWRRSDGNDVASAEQRRTITLFFTAQGNDEAICPDLLLAAAVLGHEKEEENEPSQLSKDLNGAKEEHLSQVQPNLGVACELGNGSVLQIHHLAPDGWFHCSTLSKGDIVLSLNNTQCDGIDPADFDRFAEIKVETEPFIAVLALKANELLGSYDDVDGDGTAVSSTSSFWNRARKTGVAVGGGALVGVGAVLMATPLHPVGHAMAIGGVGVLGTEFEAPKRAMQSARQTAAGWWNRRRRRPDQPDQPQQQQHHQDQQNPKAKDPRCNMEQTTSATTGRRTM